MAMTDIENQWLAAAVQEVATLGEQEVSDSLLHPADRASAHSALTDMIAFLIDHNFEKLLWILYRIDVDEQKAKQLLAQHLPEDAPSLLATLILQREEKKQEFKAQFNKQKSDDIDEDLRW